MKKGKQPGPRRDWIKLGTKISPDVSRFLDQMKQRGYLKELVIDRAVMEYKEKLDDQDKKS